MITFSKRYTKNSTLLRRGYLNNRESREEGLNRNLFLNKEVRTRLQSEVKYIVRNLFLEDFLIVKDVKNNDTYLHKETLKDIGERELGFDLTDVIDPRTLSFDNGEYNDYYFFDLIEIFIVFTKKEHRQELIDRLNYCFTEAQDDFIINEGMIFLRSNTGLRSVTTLIRDKILKSKLGSLYEIEDYQSKAKIAADIVQYIFSSDDDQKQTKAVSEEILRRIAKDFTASAKVDELFKELNELVKNAKSLNNRIQDIRHTDKHTIPIDQPNLYKLIAQVNSSIVELVILAMPEEYVIKSDLESQKNMYLQKYKIVRTKGWLVRPENYIDPDDLPF